MVSARVNGALASTKQFECVIGVRMSARALEFASARESVRRVNVRRE